MNSPESGKWGPMKIHLSCSITTKLYPCSLFSRTIASANRVQKSVRFSPPAPGPSSRKDDFRIRSSWWRAQFQPLLAVHTEIWPAFSSASGQWSGLQPSLRALGGMRVLLPRRPCRHRNQASTGFRPTWPAAGTSSIFRARSWNGNSCAGNYWKSCATALFMVTIHAGPGPRGNILTLHRDLCPMCGGSTACDHAIMEQCCLAVQPFGQLQPGNGALRPFSECRLRRRCMK